MRKFCYLVIALGLFAIAAVLDLFMPPANGGHA